MVLAAPADDDVALDTAEKVPFVDGSTFGLAMGAIVMVNVLFIGLETDATGDAKEFYEIANTAFLLVYIAELTIRFLVHGADALLDRMTILDIVIIMLSFMEKMISSTAFARSLPVFRLLRLFRLTRTLKIVRYSKDMRVVAHTAQRMIFTLFWATLILVFIVWAAAGIATIAIGRSGEFNGSWDPTVDSEPFTAFDNIEYFGTVVKSFLTLFQVLTLSHWAEDIARPVVKVYPASFFFFVGFLFVTTYGILATVISNLVQASILEARNLELALKDLDRENRIRAGNAAVEIVKAFDRNGDGQLDEHELSLAMKSKEFRRILIELEVPIRDAKEYVLGFDTNNDKKLSYEELRDGLTQMDKDITAMDYTKIATRVWSVQQRIFTLEARMRAISSMVVNAGQRMDVAFKAIRHHVHTRDASALQRRALEYVRTAIPKGPTVIETQKPPTPRDPLLMDEATAFKQFAQRFLVELHPDSAERMKRQQERASSRKESRRRHSPAVSMPGSPARRRISSLAPPPKARHIEHDVKPPGEVPEPVGHEQESLERPEGWVMGAEQEEIDWWLKQRWATKTGNVHVGLARTEDEEAGVKRSVAPLRGIHPGVKDVVADRLRNTACIPGRLRRDVLPEAPGDRDDCKESFRMEEGSRRDVEARFKFDPARTTPDINSLKNYLSRAFHNTVPAETEI